MVSKHRPERQWLTLEKWRALERESDVKHEYIDGAVYALAGGSQAHSAIAEPR